MPNYTKTWKNCVTCAYWCGNRTINSFGTTVTVNSSTDKGKCAGPAGSWRNTDKQAGQNCGKWEKWPALK